MRANSHPDEARRLEALQEYGVLDTPREADFDELVALASAICEAPISVVSLIDAGRQWFKAEVGLGVRETPIDASICAHALLEDEFLEVPDTTLDPRFADNPFVLGPSGLRFYAGALLRTPEGLPLGTLCVLDRQPRHLTPLQRQTLITLGHQVMTQLELRRKVRQLGEERVALAQADRVAQERGEFLRIVTDRMPIRVGYVDPSFRYVFLNGEYERTFGFAPGEAWGRHVREIVGEEAWRTAEPHLRRALAGEMVVEEFTAHYPIGTLRVEAQYVPDFGPDGTVRGVVVNGLNVTKRYEAEQALTREREELGRTLDTAQVATWRWEIAPDRTYASERLQFFFGLTDEDVHGGPLAHYLKAVDPDDLPKVASDIGHSRETGEPFESEYRVIGADGKQRWVLARGSADLDADGVAHTLSGVLVDITDRRAGEDALRRQNERIRLLGESSVDMLAQRDTARIVETLFERIKDALGLAGFFHFAPVEGGRTLRLDAYGGITPETAAEIGELEYGQAVCGLVALRRSPIAVENVQASEDGATSLIKSLGFRAYACFPLLTGEQFLGTLSFGSREREAFDETDLEFLATVARYVSTVSERLRTGEALRQSEERYRAIFDSIDEGFCVVEVIFDANRRPADLRYLEINPAFERLAGIGDVIVRSGKTIRELIPDYEDVWVETYGRVALTGEPAHLVDEVRALGRWFEVSAARIGGEESARVAVVFNDITARRRAEEEQARLVAEVATEREKLQRVFEQAPAFMAVLRGGDHVYEYVNPAYAGLVGNRHLIGRSVSEALPEVVEQGFIGLLDTVWRTGEPFIGREVPIMLQRSPDAEPEQRYLDFVYQPVRGADGGAYGILAHGVDVTDQVVARQRIAQSEERYRALSEELEQRVKERTQELEEAVKEAEGFNYSIAHDLRTPLRAIAANASILLEDLGAKLESDYADKLERQAFNANRLGRLIDELLRLSRLSRVPVNREPIDMTAEFLSVADELEPRRRVVVQEGMVASGDRALLRTVMQNLVGNAFKFSPPEAAVLVGERDGAFFVQDEGIGFDMAHAKRMFLPFERLVRDDEFEGTGIGLANVERIVRRHGGRVWAESAPGKGATFWFTLG